MPTVCVCVCVCVLHPAPPPCLCNQQPLLYRLRKQSGAGRAQSAAAHARLIKPYLLSTSEANTHPRDLCPLNPIS